MQNGLWTRSQTGLWLEVGMKIHVPPLQIPSQTLSHHRFKASVIAILRLGPAESPEPVRRKKITQAYSRSYHLVFIISSGTPGSGGWTGICLKIACTVHAHRLNVHLACSIYIWLSECIIRYLYPLYNYWQIRKCILVFVQIDSILIDWPAIGKSIGWSWNHKRTSSSMSEASIR